MDAAGRRTGLSASGAVTLVAVVAVLFVISLPRLRSFARSENERDAFHTATLIAQELETGPEAPELPLLEEVIADLLRRLPDSELLEAGHVLRRHGYVFQLRRLAPPPPPEGVVLAAEASTEPLLAVHAWPWRHGHTGFLTFVALADGRIFRHPNPDGRWSGPDPATASGWSCASWRRARCSPSIASA